METHVRFGRSSAAMRRLATVGLIVGLGFAQAAQTTLSYLEGKDPVAPDAVTAYGHDLFGDRVNLFNGALEFEHTDLSLPGNSALPVALTRRHSAGQSTGVRGQFGDWDLDVPRIGGSFAYSHGWVTGNGSTLRCSGYSLPPSGVVAYAARSGADARPRWPALAQAAGRGTAGLPPGAPAPQGTAVGYSASEYFRGTTLHVPGRGGQEVLVRASGYANAPADGGSYPLVTHGNWQIGCLGSLQNAAGEGFVAVSPEGVRYRFDWMATRWQTDLKKQGAALARVDVYLMATLVTDRFGNWVRYTYDPANPLLLTRIDASDGREITVTNAGGVAASASDGTRTVRYGYGSGNTLTSVQQADGSRWTLDLAPMVQGELELLGEGANCDFPGAGSTLPLVGTITHPSGAVGTFSTQFTLLGRTGVTRQCKFVPNSQTITYGAVWPRSVFSQALRTKQITGPGLPALTWSYAYNAPAGWNSCTTAACNEGVRTITVTEPDGHQTRHRFGSRWRVNEGQLLQVDEGWNASTGTALRTTTYRYRSSSGQAFPDQFGISIVPNSDWLAARHRPQDQRQVTQQGTTFTWQVDTTSMGFDGLARPLRVRKFSSLGASRTEATQYHDNTARWVLGQVASITELGTGLEIEGHTYEPSAALRTSSRSFGLRTQSFAYNADGTLDTVRDAADRPTRLLSYRRGKPQQVIHPDLATERQVINNLGRPDSRTNAAGTTTSYRYDAMGRIAEVTYPGGDAVAYHPTTQVFEQVGYAEYGLEPYHWRQTVSTGNARTVRYFDALWRERLEVRYDAANPGGTAVFEETRYDSGGRAAFQSYPQRSFSTLGAARAGRSTAYDALGRAVLQRADSELGALDTVTAYPATEFKRVVTNPRGHATAYAFQAFDSPGEDSIVAIGAPEGVNVAIARDVFGKARAITRSGGGLSVTRSYVYDAHQRLCKTLEPESGATVQQYDSAGNLAWRASGLSLPSSTSCDHGSVPDTRKLSFGYDSRNRLVSTAHGDGSPGVGRSYTPDSLPLQVWSGDISWTYVHNNRRQLVQELYTFVAGMSPGHGWNFTWSRDAYGHVSALTDPWGRMDYAPNALGQPTQVSGYASNVTHHPNGALAGYTLANGVVYGVSQNTRGLPQVWQHAGVTRDEYAYDANGNVASIIDRQEGVNTRSMGYDGLDRLTQANGSWGSGLYGYDALDNMRSSTVGGRTLSHHLDANHRLGSLSGSLNLSFGYDANGNITQKGGQGYVFDIANRMAVASGKASYLYDGHGRRAWQYMADGSARLHAYSLQGRLLFSWRNDGGQQHTRHVHLGDRLIAETTEAATTYVHTDALGSPVARTNSAGQLLSRTRYEPYGATAGGTAPVTVGFTGHVNDAETGLVYMQQRYYDPVAGRFLSVDPVETDADTGESFNRYAYVSLNPYRYIDPDGRDKWATENNCRLVELRSDEVNVITVTGLRGGGAAEAGPSSGSGSVGLPSALSPGGMGNVLADFASLASAAVSLPMRAAGLGLAAAKGEVTVYRVFGGDARAQGFSWTTKDPRTVSNFRDKAGLPSGGASGSINTADFLIRGRAYSADIIKSRSARPLDGNKGGLPELVIDPKNVRIDGFSVMNP